MKHVIRIESKVPSTSPMVITLQTKIKNQTNQELYETLLHEAEDVYRLLNGLPKDIKDTAGRVISRESDKVARITLDMPKAVGQLKYWFREFCWYDYEEEYPEGVTKASNDAIKTIITFAKKHQEICVKDKFGNETNKNIIPTFALYNFIDITQNTEEEAQSKIHSIDAGVKLREWYDQDKENPVKLYDFAYVWGVENINLLEPSKLFIKLIGLASEDMDKFNATIKHMENEIVINIHRAKQIQVREEFLIKEVGNQFVFNTIPIGTNIEEMTMFFATNEQQYTLLKNELGVKSMIPKIEIPKPERVPLIDELKVEKKQHPSQVRKEEKEINYLKNKFSDKIKRVIVNKQDVTSPKNGNFWKKLEETNKSELQCLVELADDPELRDNSELQTWFQNEIEVIRNENK